MEKEELHGQNQNAEVN